jgi:TetR/AcrR family transcriptional regulator
MPSRPAASPGTRVTGSSGRARPSTGAPGGVAASATRRRNGSRHAALPPPVPLDDAPQRADATREKLLVATHELLRERVGGPVSVNEICVRAGANVAMVKYCFGSKDALIAALIERIVTGFVRELAALDRRNLSASEKLRIHVGEIVRNYVRYPYINRLLSAQMTETGAEGAARLSRSFAIPARDWYRRLLAEGHKAGEFRAVDPTLFFFTVIGQAEFFFTAQPLLRGFGIRKVDPAMLERFITHVTEMVLRGVGPTSAPRATRARQVRAGAPIATGAR